jgi:cytochrome P450
LHVVDELIRGLIRQRKADGHDAGDILSMLLAAVDDEGDGGGMSDEQVRDEAMTLFRFHRITWWCPTPLVDSLLK